jgi:serine O-acetyltransferase
MKTLKTLGTQPPCFAPRRFHEAALDSIVDALCAEDRGALRHIKRTPCAEPLPSATLVASLVEQLRSVIFPGYFGLDEPTSESVRFHLGHILDNVRRGLRSQIKRGICFSCDPARPQPDCADEAIRITDAFLERVPDIQAALMDDAQAAYEGDPAAVSPDEAIFCYPGLRAITDYRIAHELHLLQVPLLPRMITEHAHGCTGIDIHPGATIERHFFIDHGTGVVIGETCVIGRGVRLYQGVTLGAKSFPLDENGKPIKGIARHPILEDDVIVYAGATILGRVTIGRGSVIGGNVWLTRGVPPNSRIAQQAPRQEVFVDGGGI